MKQIQGLDLKNLYYEFTRYCLVGGIAFLFDYGVLYTLTQYAGIYYLVSAFSGFMAGITVNYFLSKKWVFRNSGAKGLGPFLTFSVIGVIGLGITEAGMWTGVDLLKANFMVTKVFVTGVVLLWNFTARKIMVFNTQVSAGLSDQQY